MVEAGVVTVAGGVLVVTVWVTVRVDGGGVVVAVPPVVVSGESVVGVCGAPPVAVSATPVVVSGVPDGVVSVTCGVVEDTAPELVGTVVDRVRLTVVVRVPVGPLPVPQPAITSMQKDPTVMMIIRRRIRAAR